MPLSRSELVYKRRKNQKSRNKLKGKKKHKRLDAICEKAYNRSHVGVEKVESSRLDDGGNGTELRRSVRTRKAPVLLDSSPRPPKKRQKVNRSWVSSVEKVYRKDGVKRGTGCLALEELDGENSGWRSRLRTREKNARISGRSRGESSLRGKRKLFEDFDGFKDITETHCNYKEDGVVTEKSTVVKSKRPGRIKASNVLANENQETDMVGDIEDHDENRDDVFELMDKGDASLPGVKFESKSEVGEQDGCIAPKSCERGDTAVQSESQHEEYDSDVNLETREENYGIEKLSHDLVLDKRDAAAEVEAAEVDCEADQIKDELPDKPLQDETHKRSNNKYYGSEVADHKSRIKLGRRCGLCGGGTDGKPPKVRVLDGDGSDNGAYSGSSTSEEPNYDVWDGFGDEPGWLGRLLGPINDRFGIAGIWVHQQCAVWSPEVYFAGLGCLKNVRAALYRGRVLKCSRCRRPGATIGCRVDRCPKTYHLPCARAKGCIFDHRKFLIACTDHRCLFQPHGIQNMVRLKKIKSKKMKLELRKMSNDAHRKDIEAEEKWLEKCGEDEEFLKRESKRLQRDLYRIAPVYIGGANSENGTQFQGWESVAGLQDVIQCMKEVVIVPLLYPEFFSNIGLTPPRGVLLHGYPGTGKTLVVRALVGSCARGDKRIAYFARKGADCLGKYVGDAERQLRLLFQVAEKSQPSIIFFDEIDGLAPCRTKQQDQTHNSVVSTLLALMDGLKSRGSVVVIGATNRPDAVDPALRRPGRFDREIYFPLPSVRDREAILSLHTQKWPKPITGSLLNLVAKQTIGFAGADLQALCTQAAIIALRKNFPLQEVLSAAETNHSHSKCPPIPNFFVEERDWLQALSFAPPPCSRREFGAVVNDVLASPLDTFLVPCLLKPLTRLLIHLSLDDRVWLPTPLINASKLVKNVIVSALSSRGVQSDKQWSQVDYLLQEVNVANEIEKNLLLANVLVSQTDLCSSDVIDDFNDEFYSRSLSSTSQFMGAHSSLQKNVSNASSTKTGYQVLISGNPRSGQRHLASCLLHCFLGNVDVWKVDLASISHEGHGDMIHGLTRILMRCSSGKFCMIYMPRIDLWAIDTCNEASEDHRESYSVHQSAGVITCNVHSETARKLELNSSAEGELKKASCLWTSFIGQVELMRVNTSVIILATSEIPLSLFPGRVRQFFGDEVVNCSLPSPLEHKVPRFCVQIDGKFDRDNVINSIAVKLSKDLARHFVQLVHNRSHIHENSMKEKTYDRVQDVTGAHDSKSSPVCPFNPVAITNKMVKGKSSSLLAISTLGYQILCYPHFAELCWVTSKLKAGPFANTNGPWKGWPFNSCVIGPINSTEQVLTASGSSSVKSQFGVVRGLVAIGLSAYRGEYTSPREICSEVRKVLETLVGRVNGKIQAGKDKGHFIRLLSQVAYLEDLVTSWAYSLQSLEVETPISQINKSSCMGSLDNFVCKDSVLEGDGNMGGDVSNAFLQESENLEALRDSEPTNCDNVCLDTGDEIAITAEESSEQHVSDHSFPVEHSSAPKDVENSESSKKEAAGDDEKFVGNFVSARQSNGFTESCLAPVPVNKHGSQLLSPAKASSCQPNSMSCSDNNVLSTNTFGNSGASGIDTSSTSKPASTSSNSSSTCIYQCCSECFANLYSILLKIIITEWGLTGGTDSTVEEVYHFVSSLSVKFNLALRKLSEAENLTGGGTCKYGNYFECQKCWETDASRYKNLEQGLVTDCGCHSRSKQSSVGRECSFVFSNNVLGSLDTGIDVPYHCKYEKLCLCFLIEWLVTSKKPFD